MSTTPSKGLFITIDDGGSIGRARDAVSELSQITERALVGGFKADGNKARLDLIPETPLRALIAAMLIDSDSVNSGTKAIIDTGLDYWFDAPVADGDKIDDYDRLEHAQTMLWFVINHAQAELMRDQEIKPLDALFRVGELYALGATKYKARNWEKGMDFGRVWSAMMRHTLKYAFEDKFDEVDGQHHLTSVLWCAFALLHFEENPEKYRSFDSRLILEVATDNGQK